MKKFEGRIKGNSGVSYRPAGSQDIRDFYGYIPATMYALVFELGDKVVALGGWKMENGNLVVFSDIKEGAKLNKHTIWRGAKVIMDFVKEKGVPMYATTSNPEFLRRLGFHTIGKSNEYDLLQFIGEVGV